MGRPLLDPDHTLRTARCLLRRPAMSDAQAMFEALGPGRVPEHSPFSLIESIADVEAQLERHAGRWLSDHGVTFAITDGRDGRFLGETSVFRQTDRWMLGYWIAVDAWGRGLATEAARALVDLVFDVLEAEHVWAGTVVENPASARVLQKLGFVQREEPIEPYAFADRRFEAVGWDLTRAAWRSGRPQD